MRRRQISLAAAICLAVGVAKPSFAEVKQDQLRIGLVLSGGGARGAAHIGVLRVLETLRVPISCIIGTSMGAIVGGAYAAGVRIGSLQKAVTQVNLDSLFNESPRRQDRDILGKLDDRSALETPEFGWRDGQIQVPVGVLSGTALEGVIRGIVPTQRPIDFDELPIPFRAIATDIVTGKIVVLKQGELHQAMRASMSIPSLLNPVSIDGRLLVDGGLVRNLGIDVARQTCADIVIAVNVGTPVSGADELDSFVGLGGQVLNLLTEQNVNRSKAELRSTDLLIEPILDGLGSGDFDKLAEIVPRGESAARLQEDALRALSVSEEEYALFRQAPAEIPTAASSPLISRIEILGLKRTHPDAIRSTITTRIGDPVDTEVLAADMGLILDRDDFSRVDYRLSQGDSGQVLNIYPVEKSWGPNYIQAGLKLATDFQGTSDFSLLARYRKTWVNRAGAEWRTNLLLGRDTLLATQWLQPLSAGSEYFLFGELEYRRQLIDAFEGRQRLARLSVDQYQGRIFAGQKIGSGAVGAIGLSRGYIAPSIQIGSPELFDLANLQVAGVEWVAYLDTLDSVSFPTTGVAASAELFHSTPELGADFQYSTWNLSLSYARSIGKTAVSAHVMSSGSFSGDLPVHKTMSLGGFHRLSGLRRGQYVGDDLQYARLTAARRSNVFQGWWMGASLETGRIRKPLVPGSPTGFDSGVALFVGTESKLGSIYLALGVAEHGNRALYFNLGRP